MLSRWDSMHPPRSCAMRASMVTRCGQSASTTADGTARWSANGRFFAVRLGLRMVKGLSNAHAADIIAARGERLFGSVDELWCWASVPPAAVERLAEADAFADLGLERRAALWAIRGVRDEVLPLFAAADEGRAPQPEIVEPAVSIIPMPAGRTVVEDYASVGLTLRQHPVAFLRGELQPRGIIPCADLLMARDGQRLVVAGLVLV